MKKYKAIIFDVDGTMLNTAEGIISSAIFAIKKVGYKIPSQQVMQTFIGPPIQVSFAKTYGVTGDILKEMTNLFRDHYKEKDLLKAVPYDGIYDVFSALKDNGFKLAIATYKRQDYAETIVKHFAFDKYTDIICGSDFAGKLKKNDIIVNALHQAKIASRDDAVMIGDTSHDALGAEELGMDFLGVTYGFEFKSIKDIPGKRIVGVAAKPQEILKILTGGSEHEN